MEPTYRPPYEAAAPAIEPTYRPPYEPATLPPSIEPTYRPSYEPMALAPAMEPSYRPAYEPMAMAPSIEPIYRPSYEPMALERPRLPTSPIRHTDVRRDSVTLEWEPILVPSVEGRTKSYILERRQEPLPSWSRVATLPPSTTRYTVPDLLEGERYRFRIITETLDGGYYPYEYESPILTERQGRHHRCCSLSLPCEFH